MPAVVAAVAAAWAYLGTITIVGISLTTIIVNVAIAVALSLLSSLLAKPNLNAQTQQIVLKQPVGPRRRGYGTVKVGGVWAFLKAANSKLYQIIMLLDGEIDGIVEHWFGDEQVLLSSGNISEPARFYRNSVYYGNIAQYKGTASQSADATMMADFSGEWTSDHKLTGIAYIRSWLLSPPASAFSTIYPNGLQPYNAVLRAAKVWDPRDSGQDPDDPTTWAWTDNGVLIVLDYVWNADGMALPRAMIETALDTWIAEANIADEEVDLVASGETEKRWRLSGIYDLDTPPKMVLPLMLIPMDAQLYLRGDGAIAIRTGRWSEPAVVISDEHIYAYAGLTRSPQPGDLKNEIRASYVDPDANYVEQEADQFRNDTSIAVDGLQSLMLDLTWCSSHSQARRRMKPELYRQTPTWSGRIITTAYGLKAIDQRLIRVQISEFDLDEVFELLKWAFDPMSGQVTMDIVVMPSAAWAWNPATDSGTPPSFGTITGAGGGGDGPTGLEAHAIVVSGHDRLSASVDAQTPDSGYVEFYWRTHDDGVLDDDATWTAFPAVANDPSWTATSGNLSADTYDVRARFWESIFAVPSDWTYVRSITVP